MELEGGHVETWLPRRGVGMRKSKGVCASNTKLDRSFSEFIRGKGTTSKNQ